MYVHWPAFKVAVSVAVGETVGSAKVDANVGVLVERGVGAIAQLVISKIKRIGRVRLLYGI